MPGPVAPSALPSARHWRQTNAWIVLLAGAVVRLTLLPKQHYGNSFSGRGSNTQPSNWEANTTVLSSYVMWLLRDMLSSTSQQIVCKNISFHNWQNVFAGSGVASPKFFGAKMFGFRRVTVFCLRHRFSKHKMTRYAQNLGRWPPGPLTTPMFAGRM